MISFRMIRDFPESAKLIKFGAAALLIWVLALALFLRTLEAGSAASGGIQAADRVINAAILYKSYPSTAARRSGDSAEDPYTAASEIVSSLNLNDRILQLSTQASQGSQTSGVLLQIERLYGDEMTQLVTLFESRGLSVRTAEVRAMPVGKERLLTATFSLEGAR